MSYLLLGAAVVAFLVWAGGGKAFLQGREWRFLTGAAATAAFIGAALAGVRGGWPLALILIAAGGAMGLMTRASGPAPRPAPPPAEGKMSLADARAILGVGSDASASEIQTAYARLMRLAHPDKGGTDGLARQLNAARDRLLKG